MHTMPIKTIPNAAAPYPFEAYSYVVGPIRAEDGGGFLFTMPDFAGLMADGETVEEAVIEGRAAFDSVIGALVDMGREIPRPTVRVDDLVPVSASGRFVTRIPKSLHAQLATRAKTEGVSLNTLVLTFLAQGMGLQHP